MKDILDYELFYKYPLQGNVKIADAQPTLAVNYANPSTTAPLTVKTMLPSSALRWKYPELMIRNPAGYMLPFYFNERSYDFVTQGKDATLIWNGECNFTTPVVRSGVKLSGLDDFFGVDVKDNLLIHDVMTRIPAVDAATPFNGCIYKYSNDSDGCVVVGENVGDEYSLLSYLATPRLLGWYFDLPARLGQTYTGDDEIPDADGIDLSAIAPSFRAVMYKGALGIGAAEPTGILQPGSVNVGRAQSFKQDWYMRRAGDMYDAAAEFDLTLSLCDGLESRVVDGDRVLVSTPNISQFMPFMFGRYSLSNGKVVYSADNQYGAGENDKPTMFSIHKMLWPLMQKLCFIINPFDCVAGGTAFVDPFALPYVFGLAGFMAANYDEELYNRINEAQHQGYGYTHDPMTAQSIIFKDAYKYTQVG